MNFFLKFISIFLLMNVFILKKCNGSCYFSAELQGTYMTQGAVARNQIQYSQINITEDSIPIWGICHRRINNNVILMISSEETTCYRCFNLKLVSRNILRVLTTDKDYISKCYANEEKALASCPSEKIFNDPNKYTEIILYKHLEFDGDIIRKEYCPINGRYHLLYSSGNENSEDNNVECNTLDSELDNCPSGSAMNLRFKKCSFENHEITFECLGHWVGFDKRKYLALFNAKVGKGSLGPQYRCAVYSENTQTGVVSILFSKDSTCAAIKNSKNENDVQYTESLTLYPNDEPIWPYVKFCNFPDWMQGNWQHVTVKNDTLIYRDQSSFKAYTIKCVEKQRDFNETGNVLVYSRTQCGEESYLCLKIKYRGMNIIEFQVGQHLSKDHTSDICDEVHFDEENWLTQGRVTDQYQYSACPVSGEFTGVIPDAPMLCAKLSSECTSEDTMYYQVTACGYEEVYEERKYRCLGQWQENGLVYTYTQRLDVGVYECFVGGIKNEKQIFIKEAGEHCQRNLEPFRHGMEINKIGYCENSQKQMKYFQPSQRHQKANAMHYSTEYGSVNPTDGSLLLSSIEPSVIPPFGRNGNHHRQHSMRLGDPSEYIQIPSEVVISKLSGKNEQLFNEQFLLSQLTSSTTTVTTQITTTTINPNTSNENVSENEIEHSYKNSNNSKINSKNSKINSNNKNVSSSLVVFRIFILLSLSITILNI